MTKNLTEHIEKRAQGINVRKNQTQHIKNSAKDANQTTNRTKPIQNSTRCTKVPKTYKIHSKRCAKH